MGKQKGKSKGAQTPQMDAQIAKVQTALGEDTVSVDVIKRVLAAHSNNARAAANAILDGEAFSGAFSFFFFFLFFALHFLHALALWEHFGRRGPDE